MSKKIFLAKIGLAVFMILFLVKWIKKFDGCNPMTKCVGRTTGNDEIGSEKIKKSLQSSGLQSVIQDVDGRNNAMENKDIPSLNYNNKSISSILSSLRTPHEIQSEVLRDISRNGKTQRDSTKDVLGSKGNHVNISDKLTLPRTTPSSGFQYILQNKDMRKNSKKNIPPLKKKEKQKTNVKHIFRKSGTKKPSDDGSKRVQFDPKEGDMDEDSLQKYIERDDEDDSEDDSEDEEEDDITIYGPKRNSDCPRNHDRYILRDLLSFWDQKAKKHGILYFLTYGSLIGYHRNGDVLPWDTDVDVFVEAQSYRQIRDIAVPRNFKFSKHDKKTRIVVQTDVTFPSENRTRVSCDGRVVARNIDDCSFQDPMARLIRGNRHVDVFGVYRRNATFFYEPTLKHSFQASEFYPTKPCVFMGIKTNCPSNVPAVLKRMYGADFNVPAKICLDGKWEDRVK